jgi:acyl-CoA oxidase
MAAGIGMFQMTYLPNVTFEGDYVPMALQTARFLVGCVGMIMKGKPLSGPSAYLAQKPKTSLPKSVKEALEIDRLVLLFEDSSRRSTFSVARALNTAGKTMKFEDAWNKEHVGLMKAARNHTLTFILSMYVQGIQKIKDAKVKESQLRLAKLFALTRLPEFGRFAKLTGSYCAVADQAIAQLLEEIRPDAIALSDGFGYSDSQLVSAIGSYDNSDMYDKLVASARNNPMNRDGFHQQFFSETVSTFLNKEYLAKAKLTQSHL